MVWGAFSYNGKSELAIISTSQDSNEYKRHLQGTLLSVWNELSGGNGIFMQDNVRCHVSRVTKAWLKLQTIPIMEWPPYSSDLNPIENILKILSNV